MIKKLAIRRYSIEANSLAMKMPIELPLNAQILSVDKHARHHEAILTALIDIDCKETEKRFFTLIGNPVFVEINTETEQLVYIGSIQIQNENFHYFELKTK